MRFAGRLTPDEFWERNRALDQQIRDAALSFPSYGLKEWSDPIMLGGWEWQDETLILAGLKHGTPDTDGPTVDVLTTVHDPIGKAASLVVSALGLTPLDDEYRRRRDEVEAAEDHTALIPIDGQAVSFVVWGGRERWWAAATAGNVGIVLEGRRYPLDRVALIRVRDVEPYLSGKNAYMRAFRREA